MRYALLIVLAACGGGGPGADWSGKPLDQHVTDAVNKAAFTLSLPAGMKIDGSAKPEDLTRSWQADVSDYFSEPSVTVSFESIPATDLDGFIKDAMLRPKDAVVKKEKLPDGFVFTHHTPDNGTVGVEVMRIKGATHLSCRAVQAKGGGVPSPEKTLAWLEALCMTLAIQ